MPTKTSIKTTTKRPTPGEKELIKAAKELSKEVRKLKRLEVIRIFKHPAKFFWFSFMKGVAVGLGTVFGLTVVLSLLIYLLGKIEFVPIVGEFVQEVIEQISEYKK